LIKSKELRSRRINCSRCPFKNVKFSRRFNDINLTMAIEVKSLSIRQVVGNRTFATANQSMLFTLFSTSLRTEAALFFLLKAIKSGGFRPFYGKEAAEQQFLEIAKNTFTIDHTDNMIHLKNWKHLLNNLATGAIGYRNMLRDQPTGEPMSPTDLAEISKGLFTVIRKLKVIEDWIFHHQDRLSFFSTHGQVLLPQLFDADRANMPEVIRKVMIVENNPMFVSIAKRWLQGLDLSVAAFDPDRPIGKQVEGLIASQFDETDLILLDSLGGAGPAVISQLRGSGYHNYIVATAIDGNENAQMMKIKGGASFAIPGKAFTQFKLFVE
jgi:hypothetical protein